MNFHAGLTNSTNTEHKLFTVQLLCMNILSYFYLGYLILGAEVMHLQQECWPIIKMGNEEDK